MVSVRSIFPLWNWQMNYGYLERTTERLRAQIIISAELSGSSHGFPQYQLLRGGNQNTDQSWLKHLHTFTGKSHRFCCPHRLPIVHLKSAGVVSSCVCCDGSGQNCGDFAGAAAYNVQLTTLILVGPFGALDLRPLWVQAYQLQLWWRRLAFNCWCGRKQERMSEKMNRNRVERKSWRKEKGARQNEKVC